LVESKEIWKENKNTVPNTLLYAGYQVIIQSNGNQYQKLINVFHTISKEYNF
jgi:hypothetical protein